jgi:hypothetical protein
MVNRELYIKKITYCLSLLRTEVQTRNSIQLFDINIIAENFYRDLLNHFGYNLQNLNLIRNNASAIDLVDNSNGIAIQVTSDNSSTKIKDTIQSFFETPEYDSYKRLIILLIGEPKLKYRTDFQKGIYSFDKTTDIIDCNDIANKAKDIRDVKKMKEIADFLENEVEIKISSSKSRQSNEVETIITLIEYLSNPVNIKFIESEIIENIDPLYKFRNRFAEYSVFLEGQYKELYPIYYDKLNQSKNVLGIDTAKAIIIGAFLKETSNLFLDKTDNNPKEALNMMTEYFQDKLSVTGIAYDKMAIKFYLLDELINCNVFPNPIL